MNRAERRAWARRNRGGGHTLDCGCTERLLVALEPGRCQSCGSVVVAAGDRMAWPTGTEVGGVLSLEWGCRCGGVGTVRCAVEHLA